MQGTQVQSLIQEEPMCGGAPKTLHCATPEARVPTAHTPKTRGATAMRSHRNEEPELGNEESSPRSPQLERSLYSNQDPAQPKVNQ